MAFWGRLVVGEAVWLRPEVFALVFLLLGSGDIACYVAHRCSECVSLGKGK